MMTEEELKVMEAEVDFTSELDARDIRALIAEVRRLNAAYAQVVAEFTKSDDEHAEYFRQWLEHIFESSSE